MKTFKRLSRLLIAVGLSALAVSPVTFAASNVDGYIQGEVTMTGGQPVADASVTVSDEATGFTRSLTTTADGGFRFPALSVGIYTVTVSHPGYQTAEREVSVSIGSGSDLYVTLLGAGEDATQLGTVTVTGAQISAIDIRSTASSLTVGEATIDRIPVARNTTAIALMAPGTTMGDSAFGNLPSISGSSVAENVVYINGLNVTNFRDGLGYSEVPFEFYKEFQVKLGGISAMYGRTTGGVINAVTKSGTNEFHWGASLYLTPWIDDINGTDPDVYTYVDTQTYDPNTGAGDVDADADPLNDGSDDLIQAFPGGSLFNDNQYDESTAYNVNLWASGPIIQDKLFYYVLFNPRNEEFNNYDGLDGTYTEQTTDNAFWGTKIDWNITNDHVVELLVFSDEEDIEVAEFAYAGGGAAPGASLGAPLTATRGGINYSLKYTGYLTPTLTVSAMVGHNEADRGQLPGSTTEVRVFDEVTDAQVSGFSGGTVDESLDERDQYRIDVEWALGDHLLRGGLDVEELQATQRLYYSGPNPGGTIAGLNGIWFLQPDGNIRRETYGVFGTFKTENSAFYIEDEWSVTNDLFLTLGLRNDHFKNMTPTGQAFVDLKNQWAPRLGASWDMFGDGSTKLYGSFARYFLPIAANTNIRGVGGEYFQINTYTWDGTSFDANGAPVPGALVSTSLSSDGQPANPDFFTAQTLDPMYMDEFTIGFSKDLGDGWSWSVRGMHRELGDTIEDMILVEDLNGLFNGFPYALGNPGRDTVICEDADGDGVCAPDGSEYQTYTAEQSGYPLPERTYNAITFELNKAWNGVWFLDGSYTWGRSYGNYEGWVRSDNGQTDSGITNLFDIPGITDGAYGDLPNDVRHSVKIRGAWQFAENWQVGANLFMESGRPVNVFGNFPATDNTDPDQFTLANAYRVTYFYQEGQLVPRGTKYPRTPFVTSLDLSLKYMTEVGEGDLTLGLDVFNVFDAHNAQEVVETNEGDVPFDLSGFGLGAPVFQPHPVDAQFGLPTAFQTPRYVRLSAEVTF